MYVTHSDANSYTFCSTGQIGNRILLVGPVVGRRTLHRTVQFIAVPGALKRRAVTYHALVDVVWLVRIALRLRGCTMDTPRGPILAKMFAEMDIDRDGQIDEAEGLAIGRLLAGGNAEEAKKFWADMQAGADADQSGTGSLDE